MLCGVRVVACPGMRDYFKKTPGSFSVDGFQNVGQSVIVYTQGAYSLVISSVDFLGFVTDPTYSVGNTDIADLITYIVPSYCRYDQEGILEHYAFLSEILGS